MPDQLTDAHFDWVAKFTGKDPRQADGDNPGVLGKLAGLASGAAHAVEDTAGAVLSGAEHAAVAAGTKIEETAAQVGQGIEHAAETAGTALKDAVFAAGTKIETAAVQVGQGVERAAETAGTVVKTAAVKAGTAIRGTAAKAVKGSPAQAVSAPAGRPPAPAAMQSSLPAGVPAVAENFEIQTEKETTAAGGDVKIKWKLTLQITATVFPKQGNQITLGYNSREAMVGKVGRKWALEDLMKAVGAPDVLQKSKFGVEGKMSDGKGLSIKAGFSVPFKYGTVEVAGVLVKWEPDKPPAYGTLEVSFTTARLPIPDYEEDGIDVFSLSITAKGTGSVEPQYIKIVADKLIDAAKTAVEDAGGGALGAADVALDLFLPAALGAVAIGTVAGVIDMFVQKANLANLNAGLSAAIGGLRGGIYDGLSGGAAKGSGELYQQGFSLGQQAYQQAIAKIAQRAELPPPDEIQAEAKAAAKKAIGSWKAWPEIEDHLRWAFFKKWVDENHGLGTFEGDARLAVLSCFGVPNEAANGPHMTYWADRSSLPKVLKT